MENKENEQNKRGRKAECPVKIMQIRRCRGRVKEKGRKIPQVARRARLVHPLRADDGQQQGEQRKERRMRNRSAPRQEKKGQRQKKACQCRAMARGGIKFPVGKQQKQDGDGRIGKRKQQRVETAGGGRQLDVGSGGQQARERFRAQVVEAVG